MNVYLSQNHEAIAGTLALLRHFKAFLASDCVEMRDPTQTKWHDVRLDKATARERLGWLINVAINRKSGLPDVNTETLALLYRDRNRVEDYLHRNIRHSGCRGLLITPKMQRRYPHINNQPRD